jgi:hypothetical protein
MGDEPFQTGEIASVLGREGRRLAVAVHDDRPERPAALAHQETEKILDAEGPHDEVVEVIVDVGADTLITIDADPQQTIRLAGVGNATTVTEADFLLA